MRLFRTLLGLAGFLYADALWGRQPTTDPLNERFRLTERIELELWEHGKLSSEFVSQLVRESIVSGDREYVGRVGDAVVAAAKRDAADVDGLSELLPGVRGAEGDPHDVADALEDEIALREMGERSRYALYQTRLQSTEECSAVSAGKRRITLCWHMVAERALAERLQGLAEIVERGLKRSDRRSQGQGLAMCLHIERVMIPLVRAQASSDPISALTALIAGQTESALNELGPSEQKYRQELVREAVRALIRAGSRRAVPQLKALLEAREAGGVSKNSEPSVVFAVPPRGAGELASRSIDLALIAGVRALGERGFRESRWREEYPQSGKEIRDTLLRNGVLRERP